MVLISGRPNRMSEDQALAGLGRTFPLVPDAGGKMPEIGSVILNCKPTSSSALLLGLFFGVAAI